jgi:hypothetical protein
VGRIPVVPQVEQVDLALAGELAAKAPPVGVETENKPCSTTRAGPGSPRICAFRESGTLETIRLRRSVEAIRPRDPDAAKRADHNLALVGSRTQGDCAALGESKRTETGPAGDRDL